MGRPRGRPRDADADARILAAAYELVASVGYEHMTVDDIVARAGVSKATVYRRWVTKEELVIRALQERAVRDHPPPTGHWRSDMEQAVESMIELLNTDAGRAMVAVTAATYGTLELGRLFTRNDERGPVGGLRTAIEEGIACGDLRADLDVDLMMDLSVAVLSFRMIALGERLPEGLSKDIVGVLIDGAAQRP